MHMRGDLEPDLLPAGFTLYCKLVVKVCWECAAVHSLPGSGGSPRCGSCSHLLHATLTKTSLVPSEALARASRAGCGPAEPSGGAKPWTRWQEWQQEQHSSLAGHLAGPSYVQDSCGSRDCLLLAARSPATAGIGYCCRLLHLSLLVLGSLGFPVCLIFVLFAACLCVSAELSLTRTSSVMVFPPQSFPAQEVCSLMWA